MFELLLPNSKSAYQYCKKKKKWGKRWHSQNYKTIRKRLGGRGLTNQRFRYGMFVHRRKHRPAICPWTSSPPAKKRFTHMNWLPIELQHSWRWLQKKIETVRRWEWEEQCRRNHLGSRISDWLIRRRFRIQDDEDGGGCWSSEASAASLIGATPSSPLSFRYPWFYDGSEVEEEEEERSAFGKFRRRLFKSPESLFYLQNICLPDPVE